MRTELDKQMSPVWRRAVAAEELRQSEKRAAAAERCLEAELRLRAARQSRRAALRLGRVWPEPNPLFENLKRRGLLKGGA